jgi:hypothetical protein
MSDATAVSFAENVYKPLLYIIPIGVTMSCVGGKYDCFKNMKYFKSLYLAASGNIFTIGQMFNGKKTKRILINY